jgi:hypothetical protein
VGNGNSFVNSKLGIKSRTCLEQLGCHFGKWAGGNISRKANLYKPILTCNLLIQLSTSSFSQGLAVGHEKKTFNWTDMSNILVFYNVYNITIRLSIIKIIIRFLPCRFFLAVSNWSSPFLINLKIKNGTKN